MIKEKNRENRLDDIPIPKKNPIKKKKKKVVTEVPKKDKIIEKKEVKNPTAEKKTKTKKSEETEIESLKITVRNLNEEDITSRNLKNIKGILITEISNKSPLKGLLNINDIIIEARRTPISKPSDLIDIVEKMKKKGDKNLLLSIIDNNNRRRYLGVKIN